MGDGLHRDLDRGVLVSGLHAWSAVRFLYFVVLAVPVTGAWLWGCERYLNQRPGEDRDYTRWLGQLGSRLMSGGGLLALLFYSAWMSSLPGTAQGFAASLWSVLALVATLALAVCPLLFKAGGGDYRPFAIATAALLAIACGREALRLAILGGAHGYDLATYAVHVDGYGAGLFFLTFAALGGPAVAFSVALSWEAGKAATPYTASPRVARLGTWAPGHLGGGGAGGLGRPIFPVRIPHPAAPRMNP